VNQAINTNDSAFCLAKTDASFNLAMTDLGAAALHGDAVVTCPKHPMTGLAIGEYFNIYEVDESGVISQGSRSHAHRDIASLLDTSECPGMRLFRSVGDKPRVCVRMNEAKHRIVLGLGAAAPNRAGDRSVGTKPFDHHFDSFFSGCLFCVELRSGGFLC